MIKRPVKTIKGWANRMMADAGHRRLFLESAWLGYLVFTIVAFPCCGISIMLPSILLCGFATWLYHYKSGLLTMALSLPYSMLIIMYHTGNPQAWRTAIEPGGFFAQLVAVLFIAVVKNNRFKTLELTRLIEERIRERNRELNEINEYIMNHSEAGNAALSDKLYHIVKDQLTGLLFHSDALLTVLTFSNAPQREMAVRLLAIAEQNIEQIESLSWKLSSRAINKSGIEQTLREMSEYLKKTAGTHFSISITDRQKNTPSPFSQPIYRIIHETVTNALRHGNASHIEIQLEVDDEAFALTVINNGCPLPDSLTEGVGLQLIRQRAEKIHASIQYTLDPSGQTIFTCTSNLNIHTG